MNQRAQIDDVRRRMNGAGYRPVMLDDLIEGRELVKVDVAECYTHGAKYPIIGLVESGTTLILLDDEEPMNLDEGCTVVQYHCLSHTEDEMGRIPLEEVLLDLYIPTNTNLNELRYFVAI